MIALLSKPEEELNEEAQQKLFKRSCISGVDSVQQAQGAAQWQDAYRDPTHFPEM